MERTYQGDETTGFQSPAQDYVEQAVDLADVLDLRRPNRFPVRVKGQALASRGICEGDVLVIDTAAPPASGAVCVAMLAGKLILAVLRQDREGWSIHPGQGAPVLVQGEDMEVWGLVTALVRCAV
ncbi:MAG: LexA family protein [Caulobacteraceae bacterium]